MACNSDENMNLAIADVLSGALSYQKAATKYGITKSRLHKYVKKYGREMEQRDDSCLGKTSQSTHALCSIYVSGGAGISICKWTAIQGVC